MAVSITIRNVPDKVRDALAARAARAGRSLQEQLRADLIDLAARPSIDEWLEEVREHKRASGARLTPAQILRYKRADKR